MIRGTTKELFERVLVENVNFSKNEFYTLISFLEKIGKARKIGEVESTGSKGRRANIIEIDEEISFSIRQNIP